MLTFLFSTIHVKNIGGNTKTLKLCISKLRIDFRYRVTATITS